MGKGRRGKGKGRGPKQAQGLAPVILAAGASRRLGQCKALVDLEGCTPLQRLALGALELSAGGTIACAPTLVVVGPDADQIAGQLPAGCELLSNPQAHAGRTGGLALAASQRRGFDLVIIPVDVPRVPPQVFADLAGAWLAQGTPPRGWLAPRFEGRFGHPIVIGGQLAAKLAAFPPDRPLSDLRALAQPLLSLECPFPEILEDLDTPGDLQALRELLAGSEDSPQLDSE